MNDIISLNEVNSFYCSIEVNNEEDKKEFYKMISGDHTKLSSIINSAISLKNVYCEVIEMEGVDGDMVKAPYIVLENTEGEFFSCVSGGIFNSLKNIIKCFGNPPWDHMQVKVVQKDTKNGRRIFRLDVV